MNKGQAERPRTVVRELADGPSVEAAIDALSDAPGSFVLESSDHGHDWGRYTVLGTEPVETFDSDGGDWLTELTARVGPTDAGLSDARVPLVGGWVGYIGYEAGAEMHGVPTRRDRDFALPRVHMALHETVAVYDHWRGAWHIAGVERLKDGARSSVEERLTVMEDRLRRLPQRSTSTRIAVRIGDAEPVMTPREYAAIVERIRRYISAGDVYQVNVTQRWSATCGLSGAELYRRVRRTNPAPFAALLTVGDAAIISASPELFLDVRGRDVVTRPIKGTRPRSGDAEGDAIRARELTGSEKDRSELTMIVDLMRNDLGRVCTIGSVRVVRAGELEAHPSVYHLVATVEGRLSETRGWGDLLRSAFPAGSITGAPKIRAMQIIDELEPGERGVYCGAIGWIGLDGSMRLNVAIRTLIVDRGRLHWFSGGAIVADSDAESEYEESLAKVAGLRLAFGAEESTVVARWAENPPSTR